MSVAPTMVLSPKLDQRLSPELVVLASMLALSAPELEEFVDAELDENPALERVDEGRSCPECDGRAVACGCASRSFPRAWSGAPVDSSALAAVVSDRERLRLDARLLCAPEDEAVVDHVVDSLDDHGLLPRTTDEIAVELGVPRRVADRALDAVRQAGPPGTASRDVRECLLSQLTRLEGPREEHELARRVVSGHLAALARGAYAKVARELGVERDDVVAAHAFIRARLRPYPSFDSGSLGAASTAPPVQPDIFVRERPGVPGYVVDVVDPPALRVRLSPYWERVLAGADRLTPTECRVVRSQVARTRTFLARLEQRRLTLLNVAQCVVEHQRSFIRNGRSDLRPLTRRKVALELGLHESTVSRAVAGKYVQLPTSRLIPFAGFFAPSGASHEALTRLVQEEARPLSDGELASELAARGFPVARRTVAKYRERLRIPPQALR